jgi:hypothetical protein
LNGNSGDVDERALIHTDPVSIREAMRHLQHEYARQFFGARGDHVCKPGYVPGR